MTFAIRVLKFIHPDAERERMEFRAFLARALAEAEDVNRTVNKFVNTSVNTPKKSNGEGHF